MIKINQLYHYGMTDFEIYEATRAYWRVNIEQASKVEYAFSVYDGMVLEVFKIAQWFPAGSCFNSRMEVIGELNKRYEFVGSIASEDIRKKYVGKMVSDLFPKGNQNPIKYVWGKDAKSKNPIHLFAKEFLAKLKDESVPEHEIMDSSIGDKFFELKFKMDCGEKYIKKYGERAFKDPVAFESVCKDICSIDLLGSAIFSQWRYYNHWACSSIRGDESMQWFTLALNRLIELTK